MKKVSVLFFALLLSAASITAKEKPVLGEWLLTIAEMDGHSQDVYSEVVFKEDGYAEMDGRVFGTWQYDKKAKSVTIISEMIEEFAGTRKVLTPNKGEMVFSGDGLKLHFIKLDKAKIKEENSNSGLLGLWQFATEGETTYIKFEEPNVVSYYNVSEYSTSSGKGIWMFNKSEASVILVLNNRALSGNNKVAEISANSFKIIKEDNTINAVKVAQGADNIERLSFTADDIYDSMEKGNVSLEGIGFSWDDGEAKYNYLKEITQLSYTHTSYLKQLLAFVDSQISTPVTFNQDYEQINMDPIFGELSASEMDGQNLFYPLEVDDSYRVIGEEEVTVPAGTFTCTVVESVGGYGDLKIRIYLIKNRPGIYAKIIMQKEEGEESSAEQYELSVIEGNYPQIKNSNLVGKWLLVKSEKNGRVRKMSNEVEFINDGRFIMGGANGTWDFKDKLLLTNNGEVAEYIVSENTQNTLIYTNGETTLYFIKWDVSNNTNSPLIGYWSLIAGGDYNYQLISLAKDNNYYDIEGIHELPIENNYPRLVGQWMHNSEAATLSLNLTDGQAVLTGSYAIKKLEQDLMVFENGMMYVKIKPEIITKSNEASGLIGKWKIEMGTDQFYYFELQAPFLFKGGRTPDELYNVNIWFYNPDKKQFFAGAEEYGFGGLHIVTELTTDTITFENGRVATRIK